MSGRVVGLGRANFVVPHHIVRHNSLKMQITARSLSKELDEKILWSCITLLRHNSLKLQITVLSL